jgi:hypothetical protein
LGNDAHKGKWMKIFVTVLALCAFAPGASAAGADCRALQSTSARLACYDVASPPKIDKPKAVEKVVEKDAARSEYKDPFLAEDARTTARLKGICRGC